MTRSPLPKPRACQPVIRLLRCPTHGYEALAIGDTRVTASKCCGSWREVKTFTLCEPSDYIGDLLERDRLAREDETL
jgi:hypothetical protein